MCVSVAESAENRGASVILRSAILLPLVILRSFATKNLSYHHAIETGGKILRCAQNDKGKELSF